jgi:adenylate cyclase
VNVASRLEAHGEPGRILVSDGVVERLAERFVFSPVRLVDVKGKGPTPVRFLIGRASSETVHLPSPGGARSSVE